MSYRADIDALRGVAVLLVCLFHLFPHYFSNGFLGVDIFFAISGYLITSILVSKQGSFLKEICCFYSRRIKRLFPALLTVLASCLVLGWFFLFPEEFQQLCLHVFRSSVYWMNYTLYSEIGYFDVDASHKSLLHMWSLSVEEHFYIIWPFIILTLRRYTSLLFGAVSIIFIVSLGWFLYVFQQNPELAFYSSLTRFWELSAGGLLALTLKNRSAPSRIFNIISWSTLLFIVFYPSANSFEPYKLILSLLATCGILASPTFTRLLVPFRYIGHISYPLYLWHYVIISFAIVLFNLELSLLVSTSIFLLSILLAVITTIIIEPLRFQKWSLFPLLGSAILIGGIGYWGKEHGGLPDRSHMLYLKDKLVQLERTDKTDKNCISLVSSLINEDIKFDYCRATNKSSSNNKYILLIGDSHAHALYPGIAHFAEKYGYETLLVANSSCPPFPDFPWGKDAEDKENCQVKINQMLKLASSPLTIKKAIITTRGPIYIHGKIQGDYTEEKILKNLQIHASSDRTYTAYFDGYSQLIDALTDYGISEIFYMLENPELDFYPKQTIVRPFINMMVNDRISKDLYLLRMQKYREGLFNESNLNVTLLDPIYALCSGNTCKHFDHNYLYRDDDHFSVYGSHYVTKYFEKDIFGNHSN